jgi:hypothetical protein
LIHIIFSSLIYIQQYNNLYVYTCMQVNVAWLSCYGRFIHILFARIPFKTRRDKTVVSNTVWGQLQISVYIGRTSIPCVYGLHDDVTAVAINRFNLKFNHIFCIVSWSSQDTPYHTGGYKIFVRVTSKACMMVTTLTWTVEVMRKQMHFWCVIYNHACHT